MTEDGKLPCGLCQAWKYIGEFYTQPVITGLSSFRAIWYGDPVTGKQYGRPNSYCKKCNVVSQKGPEAIAAYRRKVVREAHLVTDVDEAWLQAHEEDFRRRGPVDPYESMMKSLGLDTM
jgi:hypothetical protein